MREEVDSNKKLNRQCVVAWQRKCSRWIRGESKVKLAFRNHVTFIEFHDHTGLYPREADNWIRITNGHSGSE